MTTTSKDDVLEKVRKLLNKAESAGVTPQEAEALTGKAAELMAKYGIDRAMADAKRPQANQPANKKIHIPNPFGRVKAALLQNLAKSMRCEAIRFTGVRDGETVHVFGFASDIERLEIMWTSLQLQMLSQSRRIDIPSYYSAGQKKAERRSWILGFVVGAAQKVEAAERKATAEAEEDTSTPGSALVLADRSVAVSAAYRKAYPKTRTPSISYTGNSYGSGYAAGQRANIGGTGLGRRTAGALTR